MLSTDLVVLAESAIFERCRRVAGQCDKNTGNVQRNSVAQNYLTPYGLIIAIDRLISAQLNVKVHGGG